MVKFLTKTQTGERTGKDMKKQLELTTKQLEDVGFTGKHYPADENEPTRVCYSLPVVNGEFIYNERGEYGQGAYKWFLKTTIGDAANYSWLDIGCIEELYTLLSCFRVRFKFIMN